MYSRRRRRNFVEYSRELPKIAECAARLSHVQTRVINSGTHLRIHTAELWGLRDNEISRANYTRGERGPLLAAKLVRQSRADFRQRRNSKDRVFWIAIRILCVEKIVTSNSYLVKIFCFEYC